MFGEMDRERIANNPYGPDKNLPRLMSEAELPEIYIAEENPVQETEEEYAGRGTCVKTQVRYDDGLTEE